MKKLLCLLLVIIMICGFCCSCGNNSENSNTNPYNKYEATTILSQQYTEDWQNVLANVANNFIHIYLNSYGKDSQPYLTDYENVIVIGSFELYSNKTADNYVCASGSIDIFIKDQYTQRWQKNQYLLDFRSGYCVGRSDFVKYPQCLQSNVAVFNKSTSWVWLGQFGAGSSTYWNSECALYGLDDILERELQIHGFSSWDTVSNENWNYRIAGEPYWTYQLNNIII